MTARVLGGRPVQEAILEEVKAEVEELTRRGGRPPSLRAVLVGDDPASAIYVRNKGRACERVGIDFEPVELPASTGTGELISVVENLNDDPEVDGFIVQLPLPDAIRDDTDTVLDAVDPAKDVDGLHPENLGRLLQGRPNFVPATPAGILELLVRYDVEIEGRRVVIVGRSNIVGRPLGALLLHKEENRNATVTLCHTGTPDDDLPGICREAEILVLAVGHEPGMFTREFVAPGAVVVDVGIHRVDDRALVADLLGDRADWKRFEERGYVLVGDVRPDVEEVAGAMTPVPGGVGLLTIAMLMKNTLKAARSRRTAAVSTG